MIMASYQEYKIELDFYQHEAVKSLAEVNLLNGLIKTLRDENDSLAKKVHEFECSKIPDHAHDPEQETIKAMLDNGVRIKYYELRKEKAMKEHCDVMKRIVELQGLLSHIEHCHPDKVN